jgi:hypothetical protein
VLGIIMTNHKKSLYNASIDEAITKWQQPKFHFVFLLAVLSIDGWLQKDFKCSSLSCFESAKQLTDGINVNRNTIPDGHLTAIGTELRGTTSFRSRRRYELRLESEQSGRWLTRAILVLDQHENVECLAPGAMLMVRLTWRPRTNTGFERSLLNTRILRYKGFVWSTERIARILRYKGQLAFERFPKHQ